MPIKADALVLRHNGSIEFSINAENLQEGAYVKVMVSQSKSQVATTEG